MSSEAAVIVNPRSQNGALGSAWPDLARVVRREWGPFETLMTQAPGDATRLARTALRAGCDLVVAVGGDGTVHEVANGFFEGDCPIRPGAALGVLPFGTGGDFRRSLGVPREIAAAARVLFGGTRRAIDVGRLEFAQGGRGGARGHRGHRIFVNIASFGIGGEVDRIVNASSKALGGRVSFLLGTARAALRYRNQKVRLVFDGNDDTALTAVINNVAVANGRYFGGGMHIAPGASLDDGKFDVVILGDLTRLDLVLSGRRVYSGTHIGMPKVSHRRAMRLDASPVDPADEVLLDVDGEAPGALPASFTLLPGALSVVVPS